jgi:hypothetical protein
MGINNKKPLENLQLLSSQTTHTPDTISKSFLVRMKKENEIFKEENKNLKALLLKVECFNCEYKKEGYSANCIETV